MTLSAYKFIVRKKQFGETPLSYADYLLDELVHAFTLASASWELVSYNETVGVPQGTSYWILRTAQLHSTASNEYLRIWAMNPQDTNSYYGRMYFADSPTANTATSDNLYVYRGNLSEFLMSNSSHVWSIYSGPIYFFGVSDDSIGADIGLNLGLKLPLFSIYNGYSSSSYFTMASGVDARDISAFTVQSDGNMFSIVAKRYSGYNGSYYSYVCMYAPDLIECANPNDTYSCGVVNSFSNSSRFSFSFDTNMTTNTSGFRFLCAKSNGSYSYSDSLPPTYYINTKIATSSDNSGKLVCVPAEIYISPVTQAGSSMDLVEGGVGFKGWVNMKYIKFGDEKILNSTYGSLYQNGDFIYVGQQILMCWNASNPNPFI